MEFRNCIECGSLFRFVSKNRCPSCIAVEEKEFAKVYDYVRLHKMVGIEQISEETGVSTRKILRFLHDDRLSVFEVDGEGWMSCSRCGKPVNSKVLCNDCSVEVAKEICGNSAQQTYIDQIIHSHKPRMYTAEFLKKTV